jgi:hypothetical protein
VVVPFVGPDQVLRNTWSYLTIFGTSTVVKDGVQCEAEIVEARPLVGFWGIM